jgi:hypothetical protein
MVPDNGSVPSLDTGGVERHHGNLKCMILAACEEPQGQVDFPFRLPLQSWLGAEQTGDSPTGRLWRRPAGIMEELRSIPGGEEELGGRPTSAEVE